jgi:hypothetical protein
MSILRLTDAEISTATAVDPETATVNTPGAALHAGGSADLALQPNVATAPDIAPVSSHVV